MRNVRWALSTYLLLSIIVGTLLLMVIMNVAVSRFIDSQARRAIEQEMAFQQALINQEDFEPSSDLQWHVNVIFVSESKDSFSNYNLLSKSERQVQDYVMTNPVGRERIEKRRLGQVEYYFRALQLSGAEYPSISYVIYYVNTSAFNRLMQLLNISFGAIIVVFALISYFIGLSLGKRIETAQMNLKAFFENATHELKTPIMSIQGYAEAILDDVYDDPKEAAQIISSESEHMNQLINEQLYLTKYDTGQIVSRREWEDLNEIIADVVANLKMACSAKQIDCQLQLAVQPLRVYCDAMQMRKVINNVVGNAIRYAKQTIIIRVKAQDDKAIVNVIDDGPGVDEAEIDKIFERYYTGQRGHTGIGLYLSRQILRDHSGTIEAVRQAQGMCFTICLPFN